MFVIVSTLYLTQHDAHRARLLASDGNSIDCMFVDKRGSPDVRATGNKVVVCCEGNAAYYELGMMEIPLHREFAPTAQFRGHVVLTRGRNLNPKTCRTSTHTHHSLVHIM